MNVLPVPYISQILEGALSHNNDCGPTSALMLAQTYKLCLTMTPDQVYNNIQPSGDVPIFTRQLQVWLASLGLKNNSLSLTLHDLFDFLVQKKPIIALIHYATLVNSGLTQQKGFRGAHFVIVTGIDIENIAINDPYRTDQSGFNQPIPINIFMQSWKEAILDNNLPYCALIPQFPICDLSTHPTIWTDYDIIPNGIYVHPRPDENSPILRVAWKGEILPIIEIIGTTGYARMTDGNCVWFAFLKKR